jgi:hypothetical protein
MEAARETVVDTSDLTPSVAREWVQRAHAGHDADELESHHLPARKRKCLEFISGQIDEKVYLAQPRSDVLKVSCQQLGAALHQARLAILPTQVVTGRTLESRIRKWIEEAAVSVHIRSDPPDPLLATQLHIAEQTGLPLTVLDRPPAQTLIPQVVSRIRDLVRQTRQQSELYFIYDYHCDHEHAGPLSQQLAQHTGRRVALPQPGETYHQAKILESDGIVLFRRNARSEWFDSHREKLQQAAALRKGKLVTEAYYTARQGTPEQVVCSGGPCRWEIRRTGLPILTDLLPFLNALPQATNAAASGGFS